ncbi:glycosyltransferase involved in cell wall biosynthesis [Xanthomonas arboricola]|uniref:glycosyltransferase family 4 protein n=1 Tax=Xanthomonas euroxanthea TaxID=2259622 RepID=UPI0016223C21|nr:glycosyltransferase family 1 protein [Xanthomonas euroxanthea]MBB3813593.1 glycosyltransferase involved in cell wall biosynthesis [Xanthomonas euroxanthea]
MRIVIDLQGAQSESRFRGIGRYSLSLALFVARRARGHDIHLALNGAFTESIKDIRTTFKGLVPPENIHVWHVSLPVNTCDSGNAARCNHAEIIREASLAALQPDVLHVSSLFEGYGDNAVTSIGRACRVPTIVTMYDLIPIMNPEIYLDPEPNYKNAYLKKFSYLQEADALLAISDSSVQEACLVGGFEREQVYNISAGCDSVFVPLQKLDPARRSTRRKFAIEGDFILYTGGADRRKNLKRLVEAYAGVPANLRKTAQLVLAGRMPLPLVDELMQVAAVCGLESREVRFTGYVTDEELVALYNECRFFVFPSWHEGFGLPVLEAMACGAAVIAANASSIREIATEPTMLFDPYDTAEMSERIRWMLEDEAAVAASRAFSLQRANAFSWEKSAESFLDACEEVHARSLPRIGVEEVIDLAIAAISADDVHPLALVAAADALDRSIAPATRMLMLDVTELAAHDLGTGIQRVTRAISNEWLRQAPDGYRVQLIRLDRDSRRYICANAYAGYLLGEDLGQDAPLVCHAGDVFLGLDLVGHAVDVASEWFDYFRATGVLINFVIYDILPVRHPEWWPGPGGQHHERWLRGIIDVSDRLICISRAVADDVEGWMLENGIEQCPDMKWFHLGADLEGSAPSRGMPERAELLLSRLQQVPSFLLVGTLEPRKGHAGVLAAFEHLWSMGSDIALVIVGKKGWLVDELCEKLENHPQLHRNLFWLASASDEFLEMLYAACTCLIAASEGEGFGLPLIEAGQRRLPVLARDIPVFREVAGEHAAYFVGRTPLEIGDAIEKWLELHARGAHPRTDAMPWLTWVQSADQLANVALAPVAQESVLVNGKL